MIAIATVLNAFPRSGPFGRRTCRTCGGASEELTRVKKRSINTPRSKEIKLAGGTPGTPNYLTHHATFQSNNHRRFQVIHRKEGRRIFSAAYAYSACHFVVLRAKPGPISFSIFSGWEPENRFHECCRDRPAEAITVLAESRSTSTRSMIFSARAAAPSTILRAFSTCVLA
jgi:hypothetical protein